MIINYDSVCSEVHRRKKEFGSMDPRKICKKLDIWINDMHLGSSSDCIRGFITKTSRCYCITVNCDLPDYMQRVILYHELGHYFLKHLKGTVCTFEDHEFTWFGDSDSRLSAARQDRGLLENEANFFAADYMLDTEETLQTVREYPFYDAARKLCVPPEFLEFKLRLLKHYGRIRADFPCTASGDFLGKLSCPLTDENISC